MIRQSEEDVRTLREVFAIPEREAWKWRVNRGEKGAVGIGRLSLKEIEEQKHDQDNN